MIDKENFKTKIFEFADKKYGDRFDNFYEEFFEEFPYDDEEFDDELHFKNFLDWLFTEKPLPETGMTIVEEFVKDNPDISDDLKACILKMKNMVYGEFRVLSIHGNEVMLEKTENRERYKVRLYDTIDKRLFSKDRIINGRIHEFDDMYRLCGAFTLKRIPSDFRIANSDKLMEWYDANNLKKIQSQILGKNKKITVMLKNYPLGWIDVIAGLYEIKANYKDDKIKLISQKINEDTEKIVNWLNEDSKYVLKLISKEGGFVKYSRLKEFDDKMSYFWDKGAPKSTIGSLVARALIFIGKIQLPDGKLHKVALIPGELQDKIKEIFKNSEDK